MINLRFSKLPRHRKFNYIPVFYDEDKEDLHARVDDVKREMGRIEATPDSATENIRRAYHAKQNVQRYKTVGSNRMYTLRVAMIAVVLTVIGYYLWDSNLLEIIFEGLSK